MDLLVVMLIVIIVGVLLWLANTYIPMDPKIRTVLNVLVVVVLVLWLLNLFLPLHTITIGRH